MIIPYQKMIFWISFYPSKIFAPEFSVLWEVPSLAAKILLAVKGFIAESKGMASSITTCQWPMAIGMKQKATSDKNGDIQ